MTPTSSLDSSLASLLNLPQAVQFHIRSINPQRPWQRHIQCLFGTLKVIRLLPHILAKITANTTEEVKVMKDLFGPQAALPDLKLLPLDIQPMDSLFLRKRNTVEL